MTSFFMIGISAFIINVEDWILSVTLIPIIWLTGIWILIKNDLWRPKKVKYVEHVIIEDKKENKDKNGKKKGRKKNSTAYKR